MSQCLTKSARGRKLWGVPIYEYQCQKCKKVHEIWQKITEEPIKKCPSCKTGKVERLIAPTGFILKGSGWYKDGYGSKKGSSSSDDAGSSASSTTDSGAGDAGGGGKGKEAKERRPRNEREEKAAEIKKKNDTAPRTDPKHKSNSPKAKS